MLSLMSDWVQQLIESNKNKIKKTKENNGVRTFHSRIAINFISFTMKLIEQTCTLQCFSLWLSLLSFSPLGFGRVGWHISKSSEASVESSPVWPQIVEQFLTTIEQKTKPTKPNKTTQSVPLGMAYQVRFPLAQVQRPEF